MSAKRRVTGLPAAIGAPTAGTPTPEHGCAPCAPLRPHRGAPSPGLATLRRRAVAELNVYVRRTPAGYVARRPGGGSGDLIARDDAELRAVLARWLGLPADD